MNLLNKNHMRNMLGKKNIFVQKIIVIQILDHNPGLVYIDERY